MTDAQERARLRELLAAAFRIVDNEAGRINGAPNEDVGDMADVIAGDLAEALDVTFDEHWPAAASFAMVDRLDAQEARIAEQDAEIARLRDVLKQAYRSLNIALAWSDEDGTWVGYPAVSRACDAARAALVNPQAPVASEGEGA